MISKTNPSGVPILVMVDPPSCCYYKLNVPEGVHTLEESCGRYTGVMEPGCYCCYCSYKKISGMITKNSVRFDAPVKNCPTKDNVLITVDVSITFHIGNEETKEQDCKNFIYYLGPQRLEELLEAESEEAIRAFIRQQRVTKVRDVKSELTTNMIADLNAKFNEFGVYIEHVVIMNVVMPTELRASLQATTAYDAYLQNHIKKYQNFVLTLRNKENEKMATLNREHQRALVELNH